MKQNTINKSTIIKFYSKVLGQGDAGLADEMIKDDYIQHSPTVKTGKSGFMEFLTSLEQLPKPKDPTPPFFRFICDDDLVAVHLSIEFMGQKRAVMDLFRFEDGMLAEHWDASEAIPETSKNQNPVVEGPILVEQPELTRINTLIVKEYVDEVLIAGKELWRKYVAEDLIQHNPRLKNGIHALRSYYKAHNVESVHNIIGEGNFVVTQSKERYKNLLFVSYDIYRLENKIIAEYWKVKQKIPDKMAHTNGMI